MSEGYEGLCIAGPLAGQRLCHPHDIFAVAMLDTPWRVGTNAQQDVHLTPQVYTYWWSAWRTHAGCLGVWSAPDTDVLRVLLETYAAALQPHSKGEGEG